MIFVRYEKWNQYLKLYPVTLLIALANIVVFIFMASKGAYGRNGSGQELLQYGALSNLTQYPELGHVDGPWRYFSSIFLHGSFEHLLFNCFAILVFLPPLERLLGHVRYGLLYLASGIVANLISMGAYNRLGEYFITVGASGAIYGGYGAFLYLALFQRQKMDQASRKTVYLLLATGLVLSFITPNINIWAHLGGLIGGFFLYGVMVRLPVGRRIG
ncbi:rhomboid family intramembrane serine protease [Saccharibacillus sp. CPCC 101409]|uniref:rhomboid family intramembrane serine protease n=1 Tax=Saccharibacillus sp. CPCC 101409 TaxID=3058041 RepID=UPI002671C91C|nr:rhomboid family intramembrane serine protease [Saccharibacillus sp. CPCC 101409]MDO3410901.1 rhomboid family intramembrane serine protease [Saccharibacillus sp. CPCC 101409]